MHTLGKDIQFGIFFAILTVGLFIGGFETGARYERRLIPIALNPTGGNLKIDWPEGVTAISCTTVLPDKHSATTISPDAESNLRQEAQKELKKGKPSPSKK